MKNYKITEKQTDLLIHFKERLLDYQSKNKETLKNHYITEVLNLTDDDTLSDYIYMKFDSFLKENNMTYQDLYTLIVGNFFIQSAATTPLPYKVIEYRKKYEETC